MASDRLVLDDLVLTEEERQSIQRALDRPVTLVERARCLRWLEWFNNAFDEWVPDCWRLFVAGIESGEEPPG